MLPGKKLALASKSRSTVNQDMLQNSQEGRAWLSFTQHAAEHSLMRTQCCLCTPPPAGNLLSEGCEARHALQSPAPGGSLPCLCPGPICELALVCRASQNLILTCKVSGVAPVSHQRAQSPCGMWEVGMLCTPRPLKHCLTCFNRLKLVLFECKPCL